MFPDKYILYWGDGDGCTYHDYHSQPFETHDVVQWEYDLLKAIEKAQESDNYTITFNNIELPVLSTEFDFRILELNTWFHEHKK